MSSRRRKILGVVLGLACAVLLAEGVARIDALFPGSSYQKDSARAFLEARVAAAEYGDLRHFAPNARVDDPSDHRPVPDPWSAWTSPAIIDRVAEGTAWFRTPESDQTIDIVLLGGSFAAQFGNVFAGEPLISRAREAQVLDGRPVRLWSLAVAAQKQPSHLHRLTSVLAYGWKPDLVVCVDGFNELAVAAQNVAAGANPIYPAVDHWRAIARGGDTDVGALDALLDYRTAQREIAERAQLGLDCGAWRSALLSRIWLAWLSGPRARFQAARTAYANWTDSESTQRVTRGPVAPTITVANGTTSVPGVVEAVDAWSEAARHMRWICDARGIPLVHATQPALPDEGAKPITDRERETNMIEGLWGAAIQDGYPRLRTAIDALGREHVLVRDGSRVFAENHQTLFADGCHLNDDGYRAYGAHVADWVREALAAAR